MIFPTIEELVEIGLTQEQAEEIVRIGPTFDILQRFSKEQILEQLGGIFE